MKEALEHLSHKNDHLTDELKQTRKLVDLHKKMLEDALAQQVETVEKCKNQGSQLLGKIDS